MHISLDTAQLFDQFLAESDLKTLHRTSGVHFSGSEVAMRRAFEKVLEPIRALLESAEEARAVLFRHGFGNSAIPLPILVDDLIARLVEKSGLQEAVESSGGNYDVLDPNVALDVILGRSPARPHLGLAAENLSAPINLSYEVPGPGGLEIREHT